MGLLGCDRCGRWHLTTRSRRSCFWEHSAVPLNPLGSSATSWDGYWLEQQKRENARDRARLHVPMVSTDPIEAALTQWGNDQLDHVDDVEALDLLVASSVYGVNRDLRTTPGQWSPTNEYADYWGYGYNNEIDFAAREFFASVNIDLPQAVTLFRGHRMPANAIPTVDSEYVDRGYVFCSLKMEVARTYATDCSYDYIAAGIVEVLWELRVHRGVFLPAPAARSQAVVERTYRCHILPYADPQLIIAPGSRWMIRSVTSEAPGTIRLCADQL